MYTINNFFKKLVFNFCFKNFVFVKFNHDNIYLHYFLKLYFHIFHTNKYVYYTNFYTSIL